MFRKRTIGHDDGPEHPLSEIRDRVALGKVIIRPNARNDAFNDFGWDTDDILNALMKLKAGHFYKRDVSTRDAWVVYDFYKAEGLCGEDVYTHFYVDRDDNLVINSFKRLEV